jgi:hypothetical protein
MDHGKSKADHRRSTIENRPWTMGDRLWPMIVLDDNCVYWSVKNNPNNNHFCRRRTQQKQLTAIVDGLWSMVSFSDMVLGLWSLFGYRPWSIVDGRAFQDLQGLKIVFIKTTNPVNL